MNALTASQVQDTFSRAGREIAPPKAAWIATCVSSYRNVDDAAAALNADGAFAQLTDLLAFKAARAEAADPHVLIARLNREADDLDATCARHMAAEADVAGRIAFCRQIPEGCTRPRNDELAEVLEPQQRAALRCANRAQDAAFAKRLQAAEIVATLGQVDGLRSVIAHIGGAV